MALGMILRRSVSATLLGGVAMAMAIGCDNAQVAGNAATQPGAGGGGGAKQIAVIAKSTTNSYWKSVEAGAKQAGQEAKVEIIWTGPDSETSHTQQSNMVDNMVNKGVAGIVLAPTNVEALVRPVDSAAGKGVPVVLIDSTLNSDKPLSVIATDNEAAGVEAAEALIKAIGTNRPNGGKVIMLRFLEGSGSTEAREKGFIDRIKKEQGIELIDSAYTKGGGSTTDAADTADALLRRFTKDNVLQVDGVFASNQPTALGMLDTLGKFKARGTTIAAPFVGFDAHEVLLAGIRNDTVAAIVTQDPRQMGYLGVKTMMAHLNGEKVAGKIPTATATITKANIDSAQIKTITGE